MNTRNKIAVAATAVVIVAGAGTGIAIAGGNDDDGTERAITGAALVRASAAALDHTGGGRVTETEVGDEESYYEVEVTLGDGRQVDVQLDRAFQVVGSSADEEGDDRDDD